MNFSSDNSAPAAPQILAAMARANEGIQPSYGADDIAHSVEARMREIFEAPEARVFLVTTGTAANALCLACLCPPWATVYCHQQSHVEEDECGAPEFYTGGAKLTLLSGHHGQIELTPFADALRRAAPVGVHNVQRGALSLTNSTELGTTYSCDSLTSLTAMAAEYHIPVHLDGARFANALVHLNCTPAEMTWKAGISAVVFGGTKNGLMGVETVILFDQEMAWEFELRRKRGGHLLSKYRYLSAQMDAYLTDQLWLKLATQANLRAQYLADRVRSLPHAMIVHPVEANMVFLNLPRHLHQSALNRGARYYLWHGASLDGDPDEKVTARLVCNWSTTESDIDQLIEHGFRG